jgi:hypothetical protein
VAGRSRLKTWLFGAAVVVVIVCFGVVRTVPFIYFQF